MMTNESPSLLVSYALAGLQRCWMPAHGRYSHRYRFDRPEAPNQSVPASDAFYTLNVLLGFARLPAAIRPAYCEISAVYRGCCDEADNPRFRKYAVGMALWAAAELGLEPPEALRRRCTALLDDRALWRGLTAQDIGMLASGATAMARVEGGHWRPAADALITHLRDRYHQPQTELFFNQDTGLRRRFSSFASQVYSMLALYQYGEAFEGDWAVDLANRTAARLIAFQGARGEWPWFYYVPGGRVVDFYEVYSVHQHGMAPAFLHHAVAHGVPGAEAALRRGFGWLFDNEMRHSMLRPAERMFYRSQLRQGERDSSAHRVARSVFNALAGRNDRVERHGRLALREECRSYELGWILWSFGGRSDYAELTNRPEFGAG